MHIYFELHRLNILSYKGGNKGIKLNNLSNDIDVAQHIDFYQYIYGPKET